MHTNKDIVVDLWKSHSDYLAQSSVEPCHDAVSEQMSRLFCPGPFYFYVLDSPTLTFDMVSDHVESIFGISKNDFTLDMLIGRIHPEDMPFFLRCEDVVAHFLKTYVDPGDMVHYKISYGLRERVADGSYRHFLLQTTTLRNTSEGALLKVFGSHTDITHIAPENNQRLSFIGYEGRPSYLDIDVFSSLEFKDFVPYGYELGSTGYTPRELELIQLMAQGLSTEQIADKLHISVQTAYTHRKNILRKSEAKNTYELVAECTRKGLI